MPLNDIEVGDSDTVARAKFSAVRQAVDELTASVSAEAVARAAGDAARPTRKAVTNPMRPGDAPEMFVQSLADIRTNLATLNLANIVKNPDGTSYRVSGDGLVASAYAFAAELGRTYVVRGAYRRFRNPSDPASDAVRVAVACYDANGARLGGSDATVIIDTNLTLTTGSGKVEVSANVSLSPVGGVIEIQLPAATRYAVPFIAYWGEEPQTDIEVLAWQDITITGDVQTPDLTALTARVSSLESLDLGTRMAIVEARLNSEEVFVPTAGGFFGSKSVISDLRYSHFAGLPMRVGNGKVVVPFYDGRNHGTRDDESIVTIQRPSFVGGEYILPIDGDEASGGTAVFAEPSDIFVYSRLDESARTFLIEGTDQNGLPQAVSIPGPQWTNVNAAGYKRRFTGLQWLSITQPIKVDADTASEINVGRLESPSDVVVGKTADSGGVWTTQVLSDGYGTGRRSYWTTSGTSRDGLGIVLYYAIEPDGTSHNYQRMTADGDIWTPEVAIQYFGFPVNVGTLIQYTPLQHFQDGRLYTVVFSGGRSFFTTSPQDTWGRRWDYVSTIATCAELGSIEIASIDQANRKFGVVGDKTALISAGMFFGVANASSNNGFYRATAVELVAGNTIITVAESIASPTVQGRLRSVMLSEWGLATVTERDMIAISRVSGVPSRMALFKSHDAGASWTYVGHSGLPISGGWISPTLNVMRQSDKTWVALTMFERASSSNPPPFARHLTARFQEAGRLFNGEGFGACIAHKLAQDFSASFVRSGYPSVLLESSSGEALVVWGEETTAKNRARVVAQRFNYAERLLQGRIPSSAWHPIEKRVLVAASSGETFANCDAYQVLRVRIRNCGHNNGSATFISIQLSAESDGSIMEGGGSDYDNAGGGGGTTSSAGLHSATIANTAKIDILATIVDFNNPDEPTVIYSSGAVRGSSSGNGNVVCNRATVKAHRSFRVRAVAGQLTSGTEIIVEGQGVR